MASLSRQRKAGRYLACAAGALALAAACFSVSPAPGATTERIATDWRTGLAVGGFDPVAYFTDGTARLGRADYEYTFGGAVWRFVNEGNRAAFAANPDVYMPRFGGYDPVAIARGASTPGHPEIWLLTDQRLYLFYSVEARSAFQSDPAAGLRAAERSWPGVLRTLTP